MDPEALVRGRAGVERIRPVDPGHLLELLEDLRRGDLYVAARDAVLPQHVAQRVHS